MKFQILFSEKNKKNIISLSSAEFAQREAKVKESSHTQNLNKRHKTAVFCPEPVFFNDKRQTNVFTQLNRSFELVVKTQTLQIKSNGNIC